jgi:predicted anti-sigma-YlaC factor YlaD
MSRCREIRPCLYRSSEGEATPDEAMRIARHLSDCTACRILLAREVRLASMLELGLTDRVPVGEEFLRSVMDALPSGPPPRSKPKRVGLKLASLALFAALPSLGSIEGVGRPLDFGVPVPPALDLADPRFEGLADVGRLVAVAVDAARHGLPAMTTPHDLVGAGLALGGIALVAAFVAVTILASAARGLLRA